MSKSTYYRFRKNLRNRFRCCEMTFSGPFDPSFLRSAEKYFDTRTSNRCLLKVRATYMLKLRLNTRKKSDCILLHAYSGFVDCAQERKPALLSLLATSRQSKHRDLLLHPSAAVKIQRVYNLYGLCFVFGTLCASTFIFNMQLFI